MSDAHARFVGSTTDPADLLAFYREHGRLPFPISGGSGEGEGDGEGDGDGEGGAGGEGEGDGETPEAKLQKALDAERKARKAEEKSRKALEKRISELENAGKPEAEQAAAALKTAQEERDAAQTKLREVSGRAAVIAAAVKADSPKPELVYRLLKDEVELDDDGEVTNADALIAKAKQEAPELFRKQTGKGGGGTRDSDTPKDVTPGLGRLRQAYASKSTR